MTAPDPEQNAREVLARSIVRAQLQPGTTGYLAAQTGERMNYHKVRLDQAVAAVAAALTTPTPRQEEAVTDERAEETAALTLLRSREMQAIGAAISLRDWHGLESAYYAGRDRLDRILTARVFRSRRS